jgi:hypothetical protein
MSPLIKILGVSILAISVMEPARAFEDVSGFEGFPVVADRELDQMRGGFETASGGLPLSFSFGIEQASFVNGQLVSTSTLAIPSLPAAMNGGGVALTGFAPITIIQNGAGNTFALPGISSLSTQVMTVIQNTLDNQVIRNETVINVSVTSSDFLRSLALQNSLNRATFSSFH